MIRTLLSSIFRRCLTTQLQTKFIETLQKSTNGINLANIEEAIKQSPQLCNTSPRSWQLNHDFLLQQGFNRNQFLSMIVNHPQLLRQNENNLLKSLECWRSTQFGEKNVIIFLKKYPQLLEYDDSVKLGKKIEILKDFLGSRRNVWKIFMNSPTLTTDNFTDIEIKIEYLTNKMRVNVEEVLKSSVFSYSMEEIKCRHIFLERLGLYKPKSLKSNPLDPNKNPPMSRIFDTSDKRFAVKLAFVTLDEFETFKDLFKKEEQQDDDLFSDDESSFDDLNRK